MIHIFLFFSSYLCAIPFSYDFASHAVQSGNLDNAQDKLKKLVIDNPDRSDVLYDLGVVSYEKGDTSQANAYFCKAAECENVVQGLKEQAHFNAGNTYVALKELKQAIEQYECTLAINVKNKYAKHNLDVTKQMLEQQQQEQQKQKQKQDQQNQNDQQQSCNDQNNEDNQPEQQNDGKQSDNEKNKNQDDSDHESEKGQGNQAEGKTECGSGEQNRNENGQGDEADDNEWDRNDNPEQKPKQHETNQQQQDRRKHTAPSQKNASYSQDKNSQHETQGSTAMQADLDEKEEQLIKDPWLAYVLQKQEEKDKQVNKKLMEEKIHDVCSGKNGQNCW